MSAVQLKYFGRSRSGAGVTGFIPVGTAADFVKRCYRNGWTGLRVVRNGEVVGAIEPNSYPLDGVRGRRVYWVEADA